MEDSWQNEDYASQVEDGKAPRAVFFSVFWLMLLHTAALKDGRVALIRELRMDDKEKLFEIYEALSPEAVRWGMPPYTRDRIEKNWLSNLQNMIPLVAFHGDRIVGHAQIFKFTHAFSNMLCQVF